ncbi:DctP family TRAP transporter solute-binding subunit [Domibacillus enclensis]|uniref:ABC transporter substrate-binding protein n=1 Tax=Domibacillus enclensis TaxID=1017273 RepID=A0A1N7C1Q1_9BACI|nr:DctP family TRAP transporter solute-binding subunit [Domibacillus enclensis]OXS74199.1 ABC transporter substrate-binding protein [Domibacillus enclensis]SIR57492.1 tripartite ATP-independent transporter solute receptor, DctP family [Domibacillus enclensis]
MKKLLSFLTLIVLAMSLAACGSSNEEGSGEGAEAPDKVQLKLSTPDPDNASVTVAAKELAKVISEKTNGEVEVSVHPNGTLYGGDPGAGIKQLGAGGLDMLMLSTSLYANYDQRFNAISVPYLFDDKEQFTSFLNDDLGQSLLESTSELGIKGLGYWARDFRQITNSVRPITEPKDLEGVKLRVPNNPLWIEFFQGAGTVTTPMDFSEVYNALQMKTIDGQENPIGVIVASKMYEVQDYLTVSNHMADGWLVGMNEEKLNGLSEEHQTAIQEAVEEMQGWLADYDAEESEKAIQLMEDEGMKVNELTSEQQQKFVEVSKQAYPTFKQLIQDDEYFADVLEFVGKSE